METDYKAPARRPTKPIEPYSAEWKLEAYRVAQSHHPMKPCRECKHPVVDGYVCGWCDSDSP